MRVFKIEHLDLERGVVDLVGLFASDDLYAVGLGDDLVSLHINQ